MRSVERSVYSRPTWNGVHSSNASAMSEPSAAWTSIEVSGPMKRSRAVDVGAEAHALLLDREDRALAARPPARSAALDLVGDRAVAHREHLEPARVGDDRPVPAHEPVQAAVARDQLVARASSSRWNVLPSTMS